MLKCSKTWFLLKFSCFSLINIPPYSCKPLDNFQSSEKVSFDSFYRYSYCFYGGDLQKLLLCQYRRALARELIFNRGAKAIHWVKYSLFSKLAGTIQYPYGRKDEKEKKWMTNKVNELGWVLRAKAGIAWECEERWEEMQVWVRGWLWRCRTEKNGDPRKEDKHVLVLGRLGTARS